MNFIIQVNTAISEIYKYMNTHKDSIFLFLSKCFPGSFLRVNTLDPPTHLTWVDQPT